MHPKVSKEDDREKVDSMCRSLTANWAKPKQAGAAGEESKAAKRKSKPVGDIEDLGRCSFYDVFTDRSDTFAFPEKICTLEDLKELGKSEGMCPYFLTRHFLTRANVIVYNYAYLLDPKIANLVSSELQRDCIVVFDECHNIDNVCIEALSMNLNRKSLELAGQNLRTLELRINEAKQSGAERLANEYK